MSFVVQNANQLRDQILDFQRAHAKEFGEELDTSEESDAWRTASAFALCLETLHAHALKVEAAIFPDTAMTEDLEHHASVYGLTRKPATAARLNVLVSNGGAGASTYALAGETLNFSDGTRYLPIDSTGAALASITTDALGGATILVEAQSTGAETNRNPGANLVWSSTPAGLVGGGETVSVARSATDVESNENFAARLLAYLRSRPSAGNCADWQSWALSVAGIEQAYVYPATNPSLPSANHTPGSVTVVVLVDRSSNNGIASSGDTDNVFGYIEGTRDESGNTLDGDERSRQKRFCSLDVNDVFVIAATPVPQDVAMNVTVTERVPTWSPLTTGPGSTALVLQVTSNPVTAGVQAGDWIAVSNPAVSGGWEIRKVQLRDATTITVDSPLVVAPGAAETVRRAWSGWEAAREAVIDVFRGLGPGDYIESARESTRFPSSKELGPTKLFVSALLSAVVGFWRGSALYSGVSGVVDGTVTTPAANVQAAPFELIVPQTITFTPSN